MSKQEAAAYAKDLKKGGIGYGTIKTKLFEELLKYFGEARERRLELADKPDYIEDVLNAGAQKARKVARKTIDEVREKVGL